VAYRVGWSTELAARALIRTPDIALPNVLLRRRVFTELIQGEATSEKMSQALDAALDRRAALVGACEELESMLDPRASPSAAVAEMLAPWLGGDAP
jgi:lipid A disaccharide synthetase